MLWGWDVLFCVRVCVCVMCCGTCFCVHSGRCACGVQRTNFVQYSRRSCGCLGALTSVASLLHVQRSNVHYRQESRRRHPVLCVMRRIFVCKDRNRIAWGSRHPMVAMFGAGGCRLWLLGTLQGATGSSVFMVSIGTRLPRMPARCCVIQQCGAGVKERVPGHVMRSCGVCQGGCVFLLFRETRTVLVYWQGNQS